MAAEISTFNPAEKIDIHNNNLKHNTMDRSIYRSFWDKYSGRADLSSMMLNAKADELEELDRADILSSLPDFSQKEVVDIGAGIGRFTTVFARSANHVISTDFIASFIEKNQERNVHYQNIDYEVSDALGLDFGEASKDLVFTNWLLMYLSDSEVIEFLLNSLRWLRPGGYMHIRESCSEPSTKKSANTLHQATVKNPTCYRFSSVYIELFKNIRIVDSTGAQWRFEVKWAHSVPVYIEKLLNWRQVHWLLKKVPDQSSSTSNPFVDNLLQKLLIEWPEEQNRVDQKLEPSKALFAKEINSIFEQKLSKNNGLKPGSVVLSFNSRRRMMDLNIEALEIAKKFDCRIWNVERDPFCYRNSLTRANTSGDRRVRFSWSSTIEDSLDFWLSKRPDERALFDVVLATEFLFELDTPRTVEKLKEVLCDGALLISLECLRKENDADDFSALHKATNLLRQFFRIDSMESVRIPPPSFSNEKERNFEWILVVGTLKPMLQPQNPSKELASGYTFSRTINSGF